MRIAMISEHASPLTDTDDAVGGAQQRHVADLSRALADLGHDVRVYTRRDSPDLADVVPMAEGLYVVHVPAGPAEKVPADLLLPHMGDFAQWLDTCWREGDWAPDVAHAHFWTSGLAAVTAARRFGIPVVQSFHELAGVESRNSTQGASRAGYERALGRAVDRVVHRRAAGAADPGPGRRGQRPVHPGRPGGRTRPGTPADPVRGPAGRAQGVR
jgi:D-inositol-3-phosphate glycosyltransferase